MNKTSKLGLGFLILFSLIYQVIKMNPPELLSPLSSKKDIFAQVKAKLDKVSNTYALYTEKSIIPQVFAASTSVDANAYAVIDYDTGQVIAQKNLSQKIAIASLTKIMTAIVALDLASSDELFLVTKKAADEIPTKIVVVPGERMSLWELLHASLMTSANDATEVIRDGVDAKYGDSVFIDAMNEKAKFIGLKNTHFVNPQGFDDPEHYSTAEDLAILSHYALTNYPLIAQITEEDEITLPANPYHHEQRLVNWNGLLNVYPNVFGLKIGNTSAAGTTTIVGAEREGKKVLVVLLGTANVLSRDTQAAQLLNAGFESFNLLPIDVTETQLRQKYATWN